MKQAILSAEVLACAEITISAEAHNGSLPADYFQRVNKRGEEYRDTFTKALLYLSSSAEVREMDCVISCVLDGNRSALETFEHSCRPGSMNPPAASHFAVATTSAGATSVNIQRKARGGCFTICTPSGVVEHGLLLSQMYFRTYPAGDVHLFLEGKDNQRRGDLTVLYVKLGRNGTRPLTFTFRDSHLDSNGEKPVRYQRYAHFFDDLLRAPSSQPAFLTVEEDENFDSAPLTARRGFQ